MYLKELITMNILISICTVKFPTGLKTNYEAVDI